MKNLGLIRNGLLTATYAAALMMSVSAVNATTIGFAPGAATNPETTFNDFGGPALNVLNKIDVFQWTTLNKEQVVSGTTSDPVAGTAGTIGLGATEAGQSWFLSINDISGNGASTDDTFTETFAFSLIGTQANDVFGTDQYGFGNESHVYMTITTTGTLTNISGDTTYGQNTAFALDYDTALFEMFFDVDGRTDDAVADIKIAEFSLISGGSTVFEADNSGEIRSDYSWNTSWDTAFEGVFDVPFGEGDATSGPGLAPLRPGLLAFKLTDQDVRRNFDSTGSDSCDGNVCYLLTSDGLTTGTSKISVPESGTLALFGIGLLGLGVAMRRRKTV